MLCPANNKNCRIHENPAAILSYVFVLHIINPFTTVRMITEKSVLCRCMEKITLKKEKTVRFLLTAGQYLHKKSLPDG